MEGLKMAEPSDRKWKKKGRSNSILKIEQNLEDRSQLDSQKKRKRWKG